MPLATMSTVGTVTRWVLACELLLGGQARLTKRLTPSLHERAMQKAEGYKRYLNFLPVNHATQHSQALGVLMSLAGVLIGIPSTRVPGACLSMSLSTAGIYSQYRMGIPYWLPVVNTILAALIIYDGMRTKWAPGLKDPNF